MFNPQARTMTAEENLKGECKLHFEARAQQNGQTHPNNLSSIADELFECI